MLILGGVLVGARSVKVSQSGGAVVTVMTQQCLQTPRVRGVKTNRTGQGREKYRQSTEKRKEVRYRMSSRWVRQATSETN